jgi:CBS domain-containing protein
LSSQSASQPVSLVGPVGLVATLALLFPSRPVGAMMVAGTPPGEQGSGPEGLGKGNVMLVSDLLEGKGTAVATVTRDATVGAVVADLARHRVGALVVSPDGLQIEGIVSERDIVQRLSELHTELLEEPVASIMSTEVRVCAPSDDVESIMNLMTEHRIRHVPVVEDGQLSGIISIGDVVKSRIQELEKDRNELMEYITAR